MRLTRRDCARMLGGAGLLAAAGAAPAAAAEEAKPEARPFGGGPFADVPLEHPAYATTNHLAGTGIFTGFPNGTFSGRRALMRYEFAVALQRMLQELGRAFRDLEPKQAAPAGDTGLRGVIPARGPGGGPPADPRFEEMLKDAERLRRVVAWQAALFVEFMPELKMLGAETERLEQDLELWRKNVETYAERARARVRGGPA